MGSTQRRLDSGTWQFDPADEMQNSYIAGEKGANRVRVFVRVDRAAVWIDYRDEQGIRHRSPLCGLTREEAKAKADGIAAQFRRTGVRQPTERTLSALIDNYLR